MTKIPNSKPLYDLEERTLQFAKAVRLFVKTLPKTIAYIENSKQLIKASGSVGSNYREANESLSRKNFSLRTKISGKEAKERLRVAGYELRVRPLKQALPAHPDLSFGHWILEFGIYL